MRSLAGVAVLVCLASPAAAERPRLERVLVDIEPSSVPAVVNSKTIFMNRCANNACRVTSGYTDSRTNKSAIGAGTLSAYSYGDTSWNNVMTCMKSMFSRFNVTITDVDPGPDVDHFEIMVGGSPTQIGLPNGIGGIAEYGCQAPGSCSRYLPNTIVFAFAQVYSGFSNRDLEICATAAQEIAHTWSLDHVSDASDPMTYYQYSGMRQFKDNVRCGSDCVNGQSPFGYACTNGEHICMSTGQATQNDVQTLTALFGPAGAKAPTLTVKNPANNSAQAAGFTVDVECTSTDGIQEVNLSIDGLPSATLTAPPFKFPTSTTLAQGPHKVSVLCATNLQAISTVTSNIIIGAPCNGSSDCQAGYICHNNACIAGPDAPGGLGATCTGNNDCIGGACANDGETMACTIPCDVESDSCPDGFGCLDTGNGQGVCWAGVGGGCCDASGGNPASVLFGLGIFAALVTRRKRR